MVSNGSREALGGRQQRSHGGVVVGHRKVADREAVVGAVDDAVLGRAEVAAGPTVQEVPDVDYEAPARDRHRLPAAAGVVKNLKPPEDGKAAAAAAATRSAAGVSEDEWTGAENHSHDSRMGVYPCISGLCPLVWPMHPSPPTPVHKHQEDLGTQK